MYSFSQHMFVKSPLIAKHLEDHWELEVSAPCKVEILYLLDCLWNYLFIQINKLLCSDTLTLIENRWKKPK